MYKKAKEGLFFLLCCLIILSVANICLCNDEEFRKKVLQEIQELKNADSVKSARISSLEDSIENQNLIIQELQMENQLHKKEINKTNAKLGEYEAELRKTKIELEKIKLNSEVPERMLAPENCGEGPHLRRACGWPFGPARRQGRLSPENEFWLFLALFGHFFCSFFSSHKL